MAGALLDAESRLGELLKNHPSTGGSKMGKQQGDSGAGQGGECL